MEHTVYVVLSGHFSEQRDVCEFDILSCHAWTGFHMNSFGE